MERLLLKKRISEWLIISGVWVLVAFFSATRVLASGEGSHWLQALEVSAIQWLVWAVAAALIISFDKHLPISKDSLFLRLLFHLPFSLLVPILTTYASAVLVPIAITGSLRWPRVLDVIRNSWGSGFYTHVVIYWAILSVYIAYDYRARLLERHIKSTQLEKLIAESQLHALQSQLHPHFLFNALNTISAHVERNPRAARRMLEQLGTLLRLSLEYSNTNEIPLEREITFLQNYLALQEARYADLLNVQWNIDDAAVHAMVPTLIFQPLVENAIVHGIANRMEKASLLVGAWKEQERLHIFVEDDGSGLPNAWDMERNLGIGLTNTRERLRCLYGDADQKFTIASGAEGRGVRVDIVFPFHCIGVSVPA